MRNRYLLILSILLVHFVSTICSQAQTQDDSKAGGTPALPGRTSARQRENPVEFGVCYHHKEEYNPSSAAVLDDLRKSGSFWIRGDFHAPAIDTRFSKDMQKKGIKVLALLYWYKKSPRGWKEYVQKEVNAAPDVPAWEILNEPEMAWWGGPISATDCIQMIKDAHKIIKTKNPNALIIGPAVGSTAEGIKYLKTLIDLRLLDYVDGISAHYYIFHKNTDLAGIEKVIAGRKPIWITETGWTTADQAGGDAAQVKYIQEYYDRKKGKLASDPSVDVIFNYELNDDHFPLQKGKDDGWGLTHGAPGKFARKPSYETFKSLLKQ